MFAISMSSQRANWGTQAKLTWPTQKSTAVGINKGRLSEGETDGSKFYHALKSAPVGCQRSMQGERWDGY